MSNCSMLTFVPPPALMPEGDALHVFMPVGARMGAARIDHYISRDGITLNQEPPAMEVDDRVDMDCAGFGGLEVAAGKNIYRMVYTVIGTAAKSAGIGISESEDLLSWRLCNPERTLQPAEPWYQTRKESGYEPAWGDPFVIFDRTERKYRMFISARRGRGGKPKNRGCVATALSDDMVNWELLPPVIAPGKYPFMAAPFVLEGGCKYYLLFHVIDRDGLVSVGMAESDSPGGPYDLLPGENLFCGRDVCVRPAVFDGEDTLFFIVRDKSNPERSTAVILPAALDFEGGRPVAQMHQRLIKRSGKALFSTEAELESPETMVRLLPRRGENIIFSAKLDMKEASRAGMLVRTSVTGKDNITLWLDVENGALSLHKGVNGKRIVSAPLRCKSFESVDISFLVDGALVAVYIDNRLVMSSPIKARPAGGVGLAVDRGKAEFRDVMLTPLNPSR